MSLNDLRTISPHKFCGYNIVDCIVQGIWHRRIIINYYNITDGFSDPETPRHRTRDDTREDNEKCRDEQVDSRKNQNASLHIGTSASHVLHRLDESQTRLTARAMAGGRVVT